MAGNLFLPGYVRQTGDKYEQVVDHPGPTSYVNTGTFATSGEKINALDYGIGGFDNITSMVSNDGLNYAQVIPVLGGSGNAIPSAIIHWYVLASGAEVANAVNLSGKSIRLRIIGV